MPHSLIGPLEIAAAVRAACVQAAIEGYEHAQIAGLCQAGAWEAAVDAIRMVNLSLVLQSIQEAREDAPQSRGPASA